MIYFHNVPVETLVKIPAEVPSAINRAGRLSLKLFASEIPISTTMLSKSCTFPQIVTRLKKNQKKKQQTL